MCIYTNIFKRKYPLLEYYKNCVSSYSVKDGELPGETEERRDKGAIILLPRLASDNANAPRHRSREEAGVGKGEEIKMQRSRAGSLAIIIVGRNTGAARSGKANRLESEQELGNLKVGRKKCTL